MSFKLLTEYHLEILSCLSLHLSKCHIVGNHVLAHMNRPDGKHVQTSLER